MEPFVVNGKKSEFFTEEIRFLGHIVSKEGDRIDLAKAKEILNCDDLRTICDVRGFLGLCSYYRRFIQLFAKIAFVLHALTRKGVKFRWIKEEKSAYRRLKEKLSTKPF